RRRRILPVPHALRPQAPRRAGARAARRPGGALPVREPRADDLGFAEFGPGEAGARRIALVGPPHPWRGGIAQYLGMLGEALMPNADVRGITFTRQYPDFLFPGESQLDPAATRPAFPVEASLDSIVPWTWRESARRLEAFAPGLVILKWW